jgi:hypothetical protein
MAFDLLTYRDPSLYDDQPDGRIRVDVSSEGDVEVFLRKGTSGVVRRREVSGTALRTP